MSDKQKLLGLAIVLALVLGGIRWWSGPRDDRPPAGPVEDEKAQVVDPPPDLPDGAAPPDSEAPAGVIEGVVTIQDEGPVIGTSVLISWSPTVGDEVRSLAAETDVGGRFRFAGLLAGRCVLTAWREGYAAGELRFDLPPGRGYGPLEITLLCAGALVVRVRDQGRRPVKFAPVMVQGPVPSMTRVVETKGSGDRTVRGLAPGWYSVRCAGEPESAERRAEVVAGRETEVRILLALAEIEGSVTRQGVPLSPGDVWLLQTKPGFKQRRAETDLQGRFRFRGVRPGRYMVRVRHWGPGGIEFVAPAGIVTVSPGERSEYPIRLPPTSISGRVTRADTGEGVGNVWIIALRVEEQERRPVFPAEARAEPDGAYEFHHLPPGTWKIRVAHCDPTLTEAERLVRLGEGGRLTGQDFELEPQEVGWLVIKVLDPEGLPCRNVGFEVKTTSAYRARVSSLEERGGRYKLMLEAGEHTLELWARGANAEQISVEVKAGETVEREVKFTPFPQ